MAKIKQEAGSENENVIEGGEEDLSEEDAKTLKELKKAKEEAERDEKNNPEKIKEYRDLLDKFWAGRRLKGVAKGTGAVAGWTGRRAVDVGVVGTNAGFSGFKLFRGIVSPIGWIWKLSKWLMIQWKNFGKEGSPEQINEYWEKVHGSIEKLADRTTEIPKEEKKK